MPKLLQLPYELVSYVVQHLTLGDVWNLSLSCKHFQYLTNEQNIAKKLLETKAPFTLEARRAKTSKNFARQLRRLLKRREAIASVSPFLVAVVALANTWIYENGTLCYVRGRQLRILHLHRSESREIVIPIRRLLDAAIPGPRTGHTYRFRALYWAHDVVSCLYTQTAPEPATWLFVLNAAKGRILGAQQLESASRIFVRNNGAFLYYGVHAQYRPDGAKRWFIHGFNLAQGRWLEGSPELPDSLGTDIGSTVCFEVFGNYFYGLSNQASLEVEKVDWKSYYALFRFPLSDDGFDHIERAPRGELWRRDHSDGPLDDRWTFMRMFEDETTGQLKVVESRKEWLAGRIDARRTYYTTVVDFETVGSEGSDMPVQDHSGTGESRNMVASPMQLKTRDSSLVRARDPHSVHPGDDGPSTAMLTISKCPIRWYHPSCQTFMDLVDHSTSLGSSEDQHIRIRGSSRHPRRLGEKLPLETDVGLRDTLDREIHEAYTHEPVILWPPAQDPLNPDPALAELDEILNPQAYLGKPHGVCDERSLVYATGGAAGGLKALVLVSWDPSIHLTGITQYSGRPSLGRFCGLPVGDGSAASSRVQSPIPQPREEKGKEKGREDNNNQWRRVPCPDTTMPQDRSAGADSYLLEELRGGGEEPAWRQFEPATYTTRPFGYHFCL